MKPIPDLEVDELPDSDGKEAVLFKHWLIDPALIKSAIPFRYTYCLATHPFPNQVVDIHVTLWNSFCIHKFNLLINLFLLSSLGPYDLRVGSKVISVLTTWKEGEAGTEATYCLHRSVLNSRCH